MMHETKENNAERLYHLGKMYAERIWGKQDFKTAALLFKQSGNAKAKCYLARMYANGKGVCRDLGMAFLLFHQSAKQGNLDALYRLGCMYADGIWVKQNFLKAFNLFHEAAEKGCAPAQFRLGEIYKANKDVRMAFIWYRQASLAKYPQALYRLGCMYADGIWVKQDFLKAFNLFHEAAEKEYAHAQFRLGEMYEFGIFVEQNFREATFWYGKAAAKGLVLAQYGLKVTQPFSRYLQASEERRTYVQSRLDMMYVNAHGEAKESEEQKEVENILPDGISITPNNQATIREPAPNNSNASLAVTHPTNFFQTLPQTPQVQSNQQEASLEQNTDETTCKAKAFCQNSNFRSTLCGN